MKKITIFILLLACIVLPAQARTFNVAGHDSHAKSVYGKVEGTNGTISLKGRLYYDGQEDKPISFHGHWFMSNYSIDGHMDNGLDVTLFLVKSD